MSIPDDRAFASFKAECLSEEGWQLTHNKRGVTVWIQDMEEGKSVHRIKVSPTRGAEAEPSWLPPRLPHVSSHNKRMKVFFSCCSWQTESSQSNILRLFASCVS